MKQDDKINEVFAAIDAQAAGWGSTIITREGIEKFTGGAIKEKHLANLDCKGLGPKGKFYVGRKAAYALSEFVSWFKTRISVEMRTEN